MPDKTLRDIADTLWPKEEESMAAKCIYCGYKFTRGILFSHMWQDHREEMLKARRERGDCKNTEAADIVRSVGQLDHPDSLGETVDLSSASRTGPPVPREFLGKTAMTPENATEEQALPPRRSQEDYMPKKTLEDHAKDSYAEGAKLAAFYKGLGIDPPGSPKIEPTRAQQAYTPQGLPPLPGGSQLLEKLEALEKRVKELQEPREVLECLPSAPSDLSVALGALIDTNKMMVGALLNVLVDQIRKPASDPWLIPYALDEIRWLRQVQFDKQKEELEKQREFRGWAQDLLQAIIPVIADNLTKKEVPHEKNRS